ncbi:Hypothetical predicted protein [Lecanosticta acicola]|uniref:Uncharacterized protein n=1 Tax=Lecanosticta acicola TaxID=111012 RepID=A0AAI9E8X8_9PEZI|nr:Hypothetical predicted protein [Lecanosticta acicola]
MEDLTSPTSTDPNHNRSLSISTAHASLQRPNIARAATTTAAVSPGTIITRARREPARPELPRAITSTASLIGRPHLSKDTTDRMDHPRASFLSRATQAISNQLELGPNDHRNAPPAPSNWSDALHRKYLVRLWDMVEEKAAKSKSQVSTTTRVVGTEKSMLHNFPELGKGDVVLNRDWVEYVLGVALRHPFCTTERMGRWEILASSGGARGTWGPW